MTFWRLASPLFFSYSIVQSVSIGHIVKCWFIVIKCTKINNGQRPHTCGANNALG